MFDSSHQKAANTPKPDWYRSLKARLPQLGLAAGAVLAVVLTYLFLAPVRPPSSMKGMGLDKVFHFLAFAALVFPMIATGPRRWVWVVPAAIAYGGAIELIQPHFGRDADWYDFVADILGVATGTLLGLAAARWLKARKLAALR